MHGREGLKTLHDHPLSINLCAFDINYKFMKKPLFGKFWPSLYFFLKFLMVLSLYLIPHLTGKQKNNVWDMGYFLFDRKLVFRKTETYGFRSLGNLVKFLVLFKVFYVFHFCLNSQRQQLKGAHPKGGGGVSCKLKVAFVRKKPCHRCSCKYVDRYAYILINYKYRTVKL